MSTVLFAEPSGAELSLLQTIAAVRAYADQIRTQLVDTTEASGAAVEAAQNAADALDAVVLQAAQVLSDRQAAQSAAAVATEQREITQDAVAGIAQSVVRAQQWATLLGAEIEPGQGYSAKRYAQSAAGQVDLAKAQRDAAESAAVGASGSATNAAATLVAFKDRWYGASATTPLTRPSGAARVVGDVYDDISDAANPILRIWNGTQWKPVAVTLDGVLLAANALSELSSTASKSAARGNLGLGALAVLAAVDTNEITNKAVTLAKQADMPTARIRGRLTANAGVPEDLTGAQVTTLLDTFASGKKGLVPAPTADDITQGRLLKADGTFATPFTAGDASETQKGIIEIATLTETIAGTSNALAVPPAALYGTGSIGARLAAQEGGYRTLATVTPSGATLDFLNIADDDLLLDLQPLLSASVGLNLAYSLNNGGTWVGWAGQISGFSTAARWTIAHVTGLISGRAWLSYNAPSANASVISGNALIGYASAGSQINALRFAPASGTFTGGSVVLLGKR